MDSALTLQERMLPNAEKVSYSALLSMDLSRFLMNTLPTPDFLREGSLWDHMIRIGFPLTTSKFMVSKALSADRREQIMSVFIKSLASNSQSAIGVWGIGGCDKCTSLKHHLFALHTCNYLIITSFQEEKQVQLQFVLCVHYKSSTWGRVHTADMWVLEQLLEGGAAANTWLLSQTHHMLPFPFHTSAGSNRNTGSPLIHQMGLGVMGLV